MLAKEKLDGVFVAPPTHARVLGCIHAMQEGLGVYAEKRLTLTIEKGQHLVRAEQKFLLTGYHKVLATAFSAAADLLVPFYQAVIARFQPGAQDFKISREKKDLPFERKRRQIEFTRTDLPDEGRVFLVALPRSGWVSVVVQAGALPPRLVGIKR